jgi:hypothetical protein
VYAVGWYRVRKCMPPKRSFDAELAKLDALRNESPSAAEPELRKAIGQRNNLIAGRAAAIALHHQLTSLVPDLAAAFERFLQNAAKSDPQCWAKNGIAKALAAFEYQEPDIFLAGIRHVQREPGWGGSTDTAGPLRGTCALALVQCRELNSHRVLMHLIPLLVDKEVPVRINAIRAIEQVGNDSAALLLRLLAELPGDEPEIAGACYSGVLALEGPSGIEWAARSLAREDDSAAEAAMAIAGTHSVEAFERLRMAFGAARDPWFRESLLLAIAFTRLEEATEWMLELVANDEDCAARAQEALCRSAPTEATLSRLSELGRPCP